MSATSPNPNRRPRRWPKYAGGALLLAFFVVGFWPKPAPVEIARVSSGPLVATVSEEGKTRIRQRYVVSAPVAGELRRIPWKAGAAVEANRTVLAVIDPVRPALLDARSREAARARIAAARAAVERARAQLKLAESERRRVEGLHREATASDQDLERAKTQETAAARDAAMAEATLRQVEAELREWAGAADGRPIELRSPVAGQVLRVFEESARTVLGGTPLLEVGDPADLEVIVEVLSKDGAAVRPGSPVILEQWGGEAPLKGVVRQVEPAAFTKVSALGVEEQRVRVVADLVTPPAERPQLGDAFRVEARIVVWEKEKVLRVPTGAIFRKGDGWGAWVVAGGRARLREVQVGRSSDTEAEVLGGLADGDEVILYPGDRISEGTRVAVVQL